jgi:Flp pilus assembly protein TadB
VGNPNKVIHVDFKSGKRGSRPSGPGLGSGFLVTVAAVVLVALLVAVAVMDPRLIASGFFAPTLIAVSVIAALWLRRLLIRRMVNAQYQRTMQKRSADKEDSEEHTLH